MENDTHLPDELVNEILLRLPVKSLGRCKSVCRRWYNHIQNPNFIANHFHHPQNPTNIFAVIIDDTVSSVEYVFMLFGDESLSLRQDIRNPINNPLKHKLRIEVILGPVNGLLFMSYYYQDMIKVSRQALWNPSTSDFRELPSLTSSQQTRYVMKPDDYFGFGSTGDDIKVVNITNFTNLSVAVMIRLYSVNDDSWKDIPYDSVRFPFIATGTHPYYNDIFNHLNGVCYWAITTDHDILFLFDMKSEELREVDLPPLPTNTYVESISVRDNNSIILFAHQFSGLTLECIDLWEMKNEGEWFKLLSFDPSSAYISLDAVSFGFWKRDEIFMRAKDEKVVLYNIHSDETRNLELCWSHDSHRLVLFNLKESITSVKRARNLGF